MNQTMNIPCPQCQALLVLPSREYLGKEVSCPQCQTVFEASEPAPEPLQPAAVAPPNPFAIDTTGRRSPTGSSRASTSNTRVRGPGSLLRWGLTTFGILVVASIGWLLLKGSGGKTAEDLAYMPNDTDFFVRIRVADILESPLVRRLTDKNPIINTAINTRSPQIGLSLKDIESVAVGLAGFEMLGDNPFSASPAGLPASVVIRFRVPIELNKILGVLGQQMGIASAPRRSTLEGYDYYQLPSPDGNDLGFCLVDPAVVVLGPASTVQAIIRRGNSKATTRFQFVDSNHQVLFGLAPSRPLRLDGLQSAGESMASSGLAEFEKVASGHLVAMAMGLSAGNGVQLDSLLKMDSTTSATAVIPHIEQAIDDMRTEFSRLAEAATGEQETAVDLLLKVLANISVQQDDDLARIEVSVSQATIDLLIATAGIWDIPNPLDLLGGGMDERSTTEPELRLDDDHVQLILTGVTGEAIGKIDSMFDDPEFVLMEHLDRWLSENVPPAVTVGATIDGEEAIVEIIGLEDFKAFADKIDFGDISAIDEGNNSIHVDWNAPDP